MKKFKNRQRRSRKYRFYIVGRIKVLKSGSGAIVPLSKYRLTYCTRIDVSNQSVTDGEICPSGVVSQFCITWEYSR